MTSKQQDTGKHLLDKGSGSSSVTGLIILIGQRCANMELCNFSIGDGVWFPPPIKIIPLDSSSENFLTSTPMPTDPRHGRYHPYQDVNDLRVLSFDKTNTSDLSEMGDELVVSLDASEVPETVYPPSPEDWDSCDLGDVTALLRGVRSKLISMERDKKNAGYHNEWNAELVRYADRSPPSGIDACGVPSWDDVLSEHSSSGDASSLSEDYRSSTSPRIQENIKSWWSDDNVGSSSSLANTRSISEREKDVATERASAVRKASLIIDLEEDALKLMTGHTLDLSETPPSLNDSGCDSVCNVSLDELDEDYSSPWWYEKVGGEKVIVNQTPEKDTIEKIKIACLKIYFTPKFTESIRKTHDKSVILLLELARRRLSGLVQQQALLPDRPLFTRKWIIASRIVGTNAMQNLTNLSSGMTCKVQIRKDINRIQIGANGHRSVVSEGERRPFTRLLQNNV